MSAQSRLKNKSETVEAIDFVQVVAQYSLNLWAPLIHELNTLHELINWGYKIIYPLCMCKIIHEISSPRTYIVLKMYLIT